MFENEARKLHYQPTPEDSVWRLRRLGWYACQFLLFLVVGFRIGPNLFLFHSPFSPGPEDFVHFTNDYVPIIAAIKAYKRDYGQLPYDSDLPPQYMPPNYNGMRGEINNTTSITFPIGNYAVLQYQYAVLEYEFSAPNEGWIIHSPRYDGRIPAPIVPAAPTPVTRPSSAPTTNTSHA
jgi:hypothetical protein